MKAHENGRFQALQTKFDDALQSLENSGPTAKLWTNYFRLVILMKQFIQAERTGDTQFASEHHTENAAILSCYMPLVYAKCAHLYLQNMLKLNKKIDSTEYSLFTTDGFFTIRRSDKFWSGVWTDMTVEQVLMCLMKS